MANRVKGETPLVLADGRRFTMVLDMEGMVEAETRYRKPIHAIIIDMVEGFLGALAALTQGALARYHPELTRADALAMLRTDRDTIAEALNTALASAFPDAVADASAEGKDESPPDGPPFGDSGAKRASTPKASGKQPRARSRSKSRRA